MENDNNQNRSRLYFDLFFGLIACCMVFCLSIPFLFVFSKAGLIGKILMVAGSFLGLLIAGFLLVFRIVHRKEKRILGFTITTAITIIIIAAANILLYLNIGSGIYNAIYIVLLFLSLYYYVILVVVKTIETSREKFIRILLTLGIYILWLGFVLSTAYFPYFLWFYKIGFSILYVYLISLVTHTFVLNKTAASNRTDLGLLTTTVGKLILIAITIAVFPALLYFWAVPQDIIKEIILPIFAAAIGGTITLAGVAWTIKWSDTNRKEEFKMRIRPSLCSSKSGKDSNLPSPKFYVKDYDYSLETPPKNSYYIKFSLHNIGLGSATIFFVLFSEKIVKYLYTDGTSTGVSISFNRKGEDGANVFLKVNTKMDFLNERTRIFAICEDMLNTKYAYEVGLKFINKRLKFEKLNIEEEIDLDKFIEGHITEG